MARNPSGQHDPSRKWPWIVGGVAALALAGALYWFLSRPDETAGAPEPLPPLVRAAEATLADRLTLEQTGFVRPRASIDVAAQVGGQIERLGDNFTVGARVAADDLLFALDMANFEADVAQAEARVEQARAAVAQARIERDRREELQDRDFASEAALQEAILGVAQADADLASARAQLTRARNALDDARVTAPFDAVVTAESAAPGQLVQPGVTVGTLVSADSVEIEMGLLPSEVDLLGNAERAIGARVEVLSADTGAKLAEGVVTSVVPRIESATRTIGLVVGVSDPFASEPGRPLRIDELVRLRLPVAADQMTALNIPAEAVKGKDIVWRIKEGTLERVEVDILLRSETEATVSAGTLGAGDLVMLSDPAAPFVGMRVRTANDGENAGPDNAEGQ